MAVLKHIGPVSAFKVALLLYFLVGVIIAALMFPVMMLVGQQLPGTVHGVFILLLPLLYAVFGGVAALIASALYNLVAGWVGGLKVEIN
ncbi:MAG: hypothetical protein ACRD1L_05545 [Terriglobales bacterium]